MKPHISSNQAQGVITVTCEWHQFKRLIDRLNVEAVRYAFGRERLSVRILDVRKRKINADWILEACR